MLTLMMKWRQISAYTRVEGALVRLLAEARRRGEDQDPRQRRLARQSLIPQLDLYCLTVADPSYSYADLVLRRRARSAGRCQIR